MAPLMAGTLGFIWGGDPGREPSTQCLGETEARGSPTPGLLPGPPRAVAPTWPSLETGRSQRWVVLPVPSPGLPGSWDWRKGSLRAPSRVHHPTRSVHRWELHLVAAVPTAVPQPRLRRPRPSGLTASVRPSDLAPSLVGPQPTGPPPRTLPLAHSHCWPGLCPLCEGTAVATRQVENTAKRSPSSPSVGPY